MHNSEVSGLMLRPPHTPEHPAATQLHTSPDNPLEAAADEASPSAPVQPALLSCST